MSLDLELDSMLLAEEKQGPALPTAEEQAATGAGMLDTELDSMLQEENKAVDMKRRSTLYDALETNPDDFAKTYKIATETNMAPEAVHPNRPQIERNFNLNKYSNALMANPGLAGMMLDPNFAKLSHDDLDTLTNLEQQLRGIKPLITSTPSFKVNNLTRDIQGQLQPGTDVRSFKNPAPESLGETPEVFRTIGLVPGAGMAGMGPRLNQGLWGLLQGAAEAGKMVFTLPGNAPGMEEGYVSPADRFIEEAKGQQRLMEEYAKYWQGDREGLSSTSLGVLSGIESTGLQIPGLAASAITGNPAFALSAMGATTFGQSYGKGRAQGLDVPNALSYGLLDATVEVGTEKFPVLRLMNDLKVGSSPWKILRNQLFQESWTEQVATALQDFNEWAYLNEGQTFSDYMRARPEAAYQTLIATLTGTTANTALTTTAAMASDLYGSESKKAIDAEAFRNRITELTDMAAQSKLYERSPDKFREAVDRMLGENEDARVYINANDFNEFFQSQGIDPAAVASELEGVAEQIPQAVALNGDIAIKASDYVTKLGTSEYAQGVNEIMRASPEKMSAKEAAEWQQNQQAEFEQAMQEIEKIHAEDQEFQQSAQTVEQTLRDQIKATGRFDEQTAGRYAALHGAFAKILGHRLGMSPEEAYQRYMLRVAGAPAEGGVRFDQRTRMPMKEEMPTPNLQDMQRDPEYWARKKNKQMQQVEMTPDEYMSRVASGFGSTVERQMRQIDPEVVTDYANKMARGEPFPILQLDYSDPEFFGQEGRHRAMAAKQAGIDLVPVAVVTDPREDQQFFQSEASAIEEDKAWIDWTPTVTSTGKMRGAPEWVTSNKDLDAMYQQLADRTQEGISGRFWYEESARAVMDMLQGDAVAAEKFIQLLAIYSPQANVQVNTSFAIRAWNQWRMGVPEDKFKVKTANQDNKAIDVLYRGKPFEGRKTSSFYLNLMHDIVAMGPEVLDRLQLPNDLVNEINKPATIDLWMYRAFGYANEAAGDDKGTGRYSFAENAVRRLTARLNQNLQQGEPRWTPHQVQAAIWTAMKSRFEIAEVKQRTWERSLAAGLATKNEKGQLQVPTTAEGMRQHRAIWREEALKVSPEQTTKAAEETGASFREFIDQNTRTVTWEAIPSPALAHPIAEASPSLRQAFTTEARGLIIDETTGQDLLAAQLGAPLAWADDGLGAYAGDTNPNTLSHLVPTKASGEWNREEVRAYARAIQYVFKQDAVPWFRADPLALTSKAAQDAQKFRVVNESGKTVPKSKFDSLSDAIAFAESKGLSRDNVRGGPFAVAATFTFNRDIDSPEALVLLKSLQAKLGEGAGFTRTGLREVTIVNYRDDETGVPFVDDESFYQDLDDLKSDLEALGMESAEWGWVEGEYGYEHNWQEDPEGDALLDQEGLAGQPVLQSWLRDRRARFEELLESYRGETLYQSPATGQVAPFDTRYDSHAVKVVPIAELNGIEAAHAPERAVEYLSQTIAGELAPRRPPSVRQEADGSYTVLDGRSGTTAAKALGFDSVPVRVIDKVTGHALQDPTAQRVLEGMYDEAGRQKDKFDKKVEAIAAKVGGDPLMTVLKGRKRAIEKIENDYTFEGKSHPENLHDLIRATILIEPSKAEETLNLIQQEFEVVGTPRVALMTGQLDRAGYYDMKFNVRQGDLIVELQVNTREMLVAKEVYGHLLYEEIRSLPPKDARTPEQTATLEAFQKASRVVYKKARKLTGQYLSDAELDNQLAEAFSSAITMLPEDFRSATKAKKLSLETSAPFLKTESIGKFRRTPAGQTALASTITPSEPSSAKTGKPSTSKKTASAGTTTGLSDIGITSSDVILAQGTDNRNARGSISFPPDITKGPSVISLFEGADLSTFLHESGHFFFEVYRDIASQPDAPADVRSAMDSLLKFVGVDTIEQWNAMTTEQRRDGHEKVARAFEAYLFEGKAPSPGLTDLFQTFTRWLMNVYKSLRGLNVELTPEVRQVFDRMLASDQEIKAAETLRRYAPLFESMDQAGMTPEMWDEYQALGAEATDAATAELQTRALRDMRWLENAKNRKIKELQKDAAAKRAAVRKEAETRLYEDPVYAAMRFITHGDIEPPSPNQKARRLAEDLSLGASTKLSKTALLDMYGDGPAAPWRYLSTGKRGLMAQEGAHPNEIAELFGLRSGDELVKKLLDATPPKEAVEALTDQMMLERYGDLNNPSIIEHAANVAVHNEARLKFLATELRAVNSLLSVRAPTGRVDVRGRPITYNVLDKAARLYAAQAIGRKTVQEAPKTGQYNVSETRAAKEAERAMRAGDIEAVAQAKRAQLLNAHFAREANKAGDEIDKILRYLRKFENPGTRKNIDQGYLDQIDQILEQYDLKRATQKAVKKRASLKEWVDQQREMGIDPPIPPALLERAGRQHYSTLLMDDFRDLRDAIKMIDHAGRLKKKLLTAKDKREFDALMDEAAASIEEFGGKPRPRKLSQETPREKLMEGVDEFFASHRKLADIFRAMDGYEDGGIMWEILMRPLNAAADQEAVMKEQATIELNDMFAGLHRRGKLYQQEYIPEVDMNMSKMQRLMVALNLGNDTNRERLNQGYGWTPAQLDAITRSLTKEDWDFVQGIWDYINSYWPQIEAKEKRIYGVAPEKVQATPVITPFGEYRGGYFPIVYDTRQSPRAQKLEAADAAKQAMKGAFARATTRRGHLEQRAEEVKRPLKLSFSVIFNHIDQVVHDLSFHEYLIDQARVLNDKRVESAIMKYHGPDVYKQIVKGMEAVASGDMQSTMAHERAADYLRAGASIAGMGWKLTTGLLQPLGLTQSMQRIGTKWVGLGMGKWLTSARGMENSVAWVHEKSPMMRLRAKTLQREINEIRNKIVKESWFKEQADKAAQAFGLDSAPDIQNTYFYLIVKLQMIADVPTWIGQYEKSMAAGETEERAVSLADQAVLDAQGGGQVKDLAAIQRGNPWFKLWTNFYSYFNVTYNRTREAFGKTNFKSPQSIGRLAVDLMLLHTLPAALATLLYEVLRGNCNGDWDCLGKKIATDQVSYSLGMFVGLRELQAMYNGYSYGGPAGARFFGEVSKFGQQVAQGDVDEALLRSANQMGGILFHYPSGQVDYTARGIEALVSGDTNNPAVVLFGPPANR